MDDNNDNDDDDCSGEVTSMADLSGDRSPCISGGRSLVISSGL